MNLQELSEKVQGMLDGEKKRRDVALEFVGKLTETLEPVAPDIWGDGYGSNDCSIDATSAVYVWREKNGKERTDIYFRYATHRGSDEREEPGFYDGYLSGGPYWGEPLEDLRGKGFWYAIQVLVEWVPLVAENIDKKSASREELLSLLA